MSNFPLRPDHTHDPNIRTEEGEQLRAVAHVAWYWPLPPDLESKWKEQLNSEGQIQTGDVCFQGGKYV